MDTVTGTMTTETVDSNSDDSMGYYGQDLLVTEPGPVVSLGKRSVVIAMGVSLRTVTVGGERVEAEDKESMLQRAGNALRLTNGSLDGRRRKCMKSS